MAAVLQKVLGREITEEDLIKWISLSNYQDDCGILSDLINVKCEFIPYFLNYLRDQTAHLFQGNRSATNTPAKTPTTAKLKKLTTHIIPLSGSEDNHTSQHGSHGNRQQLFSTPLDDRTSQNSQDSFRNKSVGSERNSFSDLSLTKTGSGPRRYGPQKGKVRDSGGGRSHRSIQFNTPGDAGHKNKSKPSLADFFKSPDNDGRNRRTPQSNRKEEAVTPSPHTGNKRSGYKGKGSGHSADRKHRQNVPAASPVVASPTFKSSELDFPPIGVEDRLSSLPDGVKVITPSRRIIPTRVSSANQGEDSQVFRNAPLLHEASKSQTPRGVWSQVASRDFSNTDNKANANPPKSKPSRRIAPTMLSGAQISTQPDNNIFTMSPIVSTDQPTNKPDTEDIRLTDGFSSKPKTPVKVQGDESSLELSAVTPTKLALERLMSVEVIMAERLKVTNTDMVDILVTMYSTLIKNFLVPNISVELYFLIQILTARGGEVEAVMDINQDLDEIQYLGTIHNAVYFSVMVLSNLKSVLTHLDRGTLRMLMDNPRITDFLPSFKDALSSCYDLAPFKGLPKSLPSPIGGVSFQADTDNRKNFPSERAFHMFKKQRDMFYELLREWEEHHLAPGWTMSEVQADRVQWLVGGQHTELANHIHFVRLFHSQLVQMCKGDSSWKKDEEDENISLLSELKQTNPKKLKRLRERLVTPASHGGPCPSPSFPGCQEFFRDFISAACNPFFNQHLMDVLLVKITEMNDIQLISVEVTYEEDEEIMIDVEDKETLLNCLLTSKLLAKFLGYINFLPYSSTDTLPESLQTDYVSHRNKTSQPLDVLRHVEVARRDRRTVVTVPWVVEYLSMMDGFASHLDYFNNLFVLLIKIYREASVIFSDHYSPTQLLVLTVLGWLFELPNFPQGLLFKEMALTSYTKGSRLALDNLNVVDQQIFYSCCPYLGEIRSLLVDFAVGLSGRSSSIRKITPMSADTVDSSPATLSDKQLQHQLEDNFFHNHPASLKKTVEFVADRVSSNHIKLYRKQDLPEVLASVPERVKDLAAEIVQSQTETPTLNQKSLIKEVEKSASVLAAKGKVICLESAPSYCSARCQSILRLMMPEETPAPVWSVAALISYRQALDKVNNWLTMHITTQMFRKELTAELEKQVKALKKKLESANASKPFPDAVADLSAGPSGGLNTSGPSQNTEAAAESTSAAAQHKSFLFDSPVRTLQEAALKPKTVIEESPMRFVLNAAMMKPPGSPSSKNCLNLSSFDAPPSEKAIEARIISSRLSKLTQEVKLSRETEQGLDMTEKDLLKSGKSASSNLENDHKIPRSKDKDITTATSVDEMMDLCENKNPGTVNFNSSETLPTVIKCDDKQPNLLNLEKLPEESSNHFTGPCIREQNSQSPSKKLNVSFHEGDLDLEEIRVTSTMRTSSPVKSSKMPKPCIVNHQSSPKKDISAHVNTRPAFCSPTEPLVALKECTRAAMDRDSDLESSTVCDILSNVATSLQQGPKDVVCLILKMVVKLSIDLIFSIALRHPSKLNSHIMESSINLWTIEGVKPVVDLSSVFCSRHMQDLLVENFETKPAYNGYIQLIKELLQRDHLSLSVLTSGGKKAIENTFLMPGAAVVISQAFSDILPHLHSYRGNIVHSPGSDDIPSLLRALIDLSDSVVRRKSLQHCMLLIQGPLDCSHDNDEASAEKTTEGESSQRKVLCSTENQTVVDKPEGKAAFTRKSPYRVMKDTTDLSHHGVASCTHIAENG